MTHATDRELLERFVQFHSDEAFASIVERHVGLVHSVALRQTTNPQHAQDITQAVFILLARKAAGFGPNTVLAGWLYHTARLTASTFRRSESRRIRREQEAYMQSTIEEHADDPCWRELAPSLEEAMGKLGAADRDALVLRYFQNRSFEEVGVELGIAPAAAQKRISRALEKLRKNFGKRGIVSTTAIIATAISGHSVQAAPVGLVGAVTATTAKGAAVGSSTLDLVDGTTKLMTWTKAKAAISLAAGLGVAITIGVAISTLVNRERVVPTDLVEFFKAATTDPFPVEHFRGQMTVYRVNIPNQPPLTEPRVSSQEGARAGDDFYIGGVGGISVYQQGKVYYFTANSMSVNLPGTTNGWLYHLPQSNTGILAEYLNMGLYNVDYHQTKVVWQGNEFKTSDGKLVGKLTLSNNIPAELAFFYKGETTSRAKITYDYPTPTNKLSGFPERITLWHMTDGEIKPSMDLQLLEVKLAPKGLPHSFFSPEKFITSAIRYTNYYNNDGMVRKNRQGEWVPAPNQ